MRTVEKILIKMCLIIEIILTVFFSGGGMGVVLVFIILKKSHGEVFLKKFSIQTSEDAATVIPFGNQAISKFSKQ